MEAGVFVLSHFRYLHPAPRYPRLMLAGQGIQAAQKREESLGLQLALLSISVGLVLAVAKILVGLHAGSSAVLSDGLEAAGDALSSTFVYTGLRLASKPPDDEHPYGHGRYETLSALAVGAILLLGGAAILWHGITSFGTKSGIAFYALYPLIASVVVKVALAILKFRLGTRIASTALQADAWHDLTDLASTSVALAAVLLTLYDPVRFGASDHIGGIIIGLLIIFLSIRLVGQTVDQLVDTMPERRKLEQIREVALSVEGALGIEKCFARRTGLKYHVDLHLEVAPEMTVRNSHDIATAVRIAIKETLPWVADVLVHVEPSPLVVQSPARIARVERQHGK